MKAIASAFLLLAACAPEPAGAGLPADFAALVPADAVAVVHLRSFDELLREINALARAADPSATPVAASDLLAMPLMLAGHPDLAQELLLDQPLGLAYGMGSAATRPVITIIAAVRQPQKLGAELAEVSPESSVAIAGQFVALRIGEGKASAAGGSPLLADFPRGLLGVRADLGRILQAFRPLIDIGLVEAEDAMKAGAFQDPEMPIDMTEVMNWYLQLFRQMMDSAERMDLELDLAGGVFSMRAQILNREGSAMAQHGRKERVDFEALAGRLDPAAALQAVGSYDQGAMMMQFKDLYRGMIDVVAASEELPQELKDAFRAYIEGALELVPMVGRETAISFDYSAGGIRVAADLEAQDPGALAAAIRELLEDPALSGMGMKAGAETAGILAGQPSITWHQSFDFAQMLRVMGVADESPPGLAEAFAQGIDVVLMPGEKTLRIVAGGDGVWRDSAARRLVEGGSAGPEIARGLEPLAGANPGQYVRMDLKPLMAMVASIGAAGGEPDPGLEELRSALAALGDQQLAFDFHWGVKQRAMFAGGSMDLRAIAKLMAAGNR